MITRLLRRREEGRAGRWHAHARSDYERRVVSGMTRRLALPRVLPRAAPGGGVWGDDLCECVYLGFDADGGHMVGYRVVDGSVRLYLASFAPFRCLRHSRVDGVAAFPGLEVSQGWADEGLRLRRGMHPYVRYWQRVGSRCMVFTGVRARGTNFVHHITLLRLPGGVSREPATLSFSLHAITAVLSLRGSELLETPVWGGGCERLRLVLGTGDAVRVVDVLVATEEELGAEPASQCGEWMGTPESSANDPEQRLLRVRTQRSLDAEKLMPRVLAPLRKKLVGARLMDYMMMPVTALVLPRGASYVVCVLGLQVHTPRASTQTQVFVGVDFNPLSSKLHTFMLGQKETQAASVTKATRELCQQLRKGTRLGAAPLLARSRLLVATGDNRNLSLPPDANGVFSSVSNLVNRGYPVVMVL